MLTGMGTVIPLGPRIREREVQAELDQAAARRGWAPDPWRLRNPRAKSGLRGTHREREYEAELGRQLQVRARERENCARRAQFRPLRVVRP